ncbi:hypothetical protein VT06_17460, partial [Arsukibacterium sp. MJ3]|uniref:hypothetical protein n=1 Tax=Arsukibacterium sp. MJ3 TaxID=1632859 RepID=UPI00062739D2
ILGAFFKTHAKPALGYTNVATNIFTHLGSLSSFLDDDANTNIKNLKYWCSSEEGIERLTSLTEWYTDLSSLITVELLNERIDYLHEKLTEYADKLEARYPKKKNILESKQLLEVLFELGLLPGYAFPTDLVSLEIVKITTD